MSLESTTGPPPDDPAQPADNQGGENKNYMAQLIALWEASALNASSAFAGLGAQLFQPGRNEQDIEYGPDGRPLRNPDGTIRHRSSSTFAQNTEAAHRAFNAITVASTATGVPRDFLLKLASSESRVAPTSISEGSPQTFIDTISYLADRDWGREILEKNPKLTELKHTLEDARQRFPTPQAYIEAMRGGQLNSLSELMNNPEVSAMVMSAHLRKELEEKYGFATDIEAQIKARNPQNDEEAGRIREELTRIREEGMRVIGGETYLSHRFGETTAKRVLESDVTESVTPFFTAEEIAAHPDLAEFNGKTAHELVNWSRDQANVDLTPFYQSVGVNAKGDYPLGTRPEHMAGIDEAFRDVVTDWVSKNRPDWKNNPVLMDRAINNFRAFTYMIGDSESATWDSMSGDRLYGARRTFDISGGHPGMGAVSSSSGLLQVVTRTWNGLQERHPELTNFLPPNQIKATGYLLDGRDAFEDVLLGRFEPAVVKAGGEWASLPQSILKQTRWTMEQVRNFYYSHGGLLLGQAPIEPGAEPVKVLDQVALFGNRPLAAFSMLPGGVSPGLVPGADQIISTLRANTYVDISKGNRPKDPTQPAENCIGNVRVAIDPKGTLLPDHPHYAADYAFDPARPDYLGQVKYHGRNLFKMVAKGHGLDTGDYIPTALDIVVWDRAPGHPSGHAAMYDGEKWISDFEQRNMASLKGFNSSFQFKIYRYQGNQAPAAAPVVAAASPPPAPGQKGTTAPPSAPAPATTAAAPVPAPVKTTAAETPVTLSLADLKAMVTDAVTDALRNHEKEQAARQEGDKPSTTSNEKVLAALTSDKKKEERKNQRLAANSDGTRHARHYGHMKAGEKATAVASSSTGSSHNDGPSPSGAKGPTSIV